MRCSWFLIPLNSLLLLVFSFYPALVERYDALFSFHIAPIKVRLTIGLVFVPAFRWFVNEILDMSIVLLFTMAPLMPPSDGKWTWWLACLWLACVGGFTEELQQLHSSVFHNLDLVGLWGDAIRLILDKLIFLFQVGPGSFQRHTPEWREALKEALRCVKDVLLRALTTTLFHLFDPFPWWRYLKDNMLDLLVRCLCIVSLVLSTSYTEADLLENQYRPAHLVSSGMPELRKDTILGFTVCLLWIRKLKLLLAFRFSGSFVYMIFEMFKVERDAQGGCSSAVGGIGYRDELLQLKHVSTAHRWDNGGIMVVLKGL